MGEKNTGSPDRAETQEREGAPEATPLTLPTAITSGTTGPVVQADSDTDGAAAEQTPPAPAPVSWATLSPEDRKRLLDEADPDELRKHDRIAGLSGQHATRLFQQRVNSLGWDDLPETLRNDVVTRARQQLSDEQSREQARQLAEQGEYYTLGQRRAEELQRQQQADTETRAQAEARAKAYREFEADRAKWASENLSPEVIEQTAKELQEAGSMSGLDFKGQYDLWLKTALKNEREFARRSSVTQEREKWEKEELPAMRSRWLAERNGDEATPEADEGRPSSLRDLTDEMIRAMSQKDFEAIWDMDADRPKAGSGFRYKPTNSVGLASLKSMGGRG